MTDNTPYRWAAAGLSLHTHAWSVVTAGGRRYAPPGKRGEDLVIPFMRGRYWQQKTREAQLLELRMWVAGLNQDGTPSQTLTIEQKLHENWGLLTAALDRDVPFTIEKKTPGGLTLTGVAETIGGLEPRATGFGRWEFDVQMLMTDPYWYAAQQSVSVGTITVAGEVPTDRVTLTMGPGRITNTRDGNWIEFVGTGTATVDCRTGSATQGATYVNGQIRRNPSFPNWLVLYPGSNAMTGSGTVAYQAAYR